MQSAALFASLLLGQASPPPNELGVIPVVMYHAVGGPRVGRALYDRGGLNISVETFRKHLKLMYDAGWYPVNMRDVLTARIEVPKGRTPVVITFDDGRPSQFQYKDGRIDPNSALGVMEAFSAAHPDWPRRAVFYVNTPRNIVPFLQKSEVQNKIRTLVDLGYEVGNHSASHKSMANMSASQLQFEVAETIRYIKKLEPRATMDTFCLPFGAWPRRNADLELLMQGSDKGTTYRNLCVLNAWGGPMPSPADKKFDPKRIPRIGVGPGNLEYTLRNMKPGTQWAPFISDGDPNTLTIPSWAAKRVDTERLNGVRLVTYPAQDPHGKHDTPRSSGKSAAKAKKQRVPASNPKVPR
jgi:peptidoglycan/xylan/chitin deacetylase (PgdA/CDA1 family)